MRLLNRLSIGNKLLSIMLITSTFAVLIMACSVFIHRALSEQEVIRERLSSLAEVIASRSTGSLTFYDRTTAAENLRALDATSNVVLAVIKNDKGEIFAEYRRKQINPQAPELSFSELDLTAPGYLNLFAAHLIVNKNIILDNEHIGDLYIIAGLDEFREDMVNYSLLMLLIVAVSFFAALLISSKLNQIISNPIKNLYLAMESVSENQDFSIRVTSENDDELGSLVEGFNRMLKQIQLRDKELASYRHNLEDQVVQRTQELFEVNKQRIQWLETMAGFLRHELKNTTVGVKTSLDLIEKRSQENKNIDTYLTRARKSMAFMNALLLSVSEASTLEAAIYKEPHADIDLSQLFSALIKEYQAIYPKATFYSQCDPEVHIKGNQDRLVQMIDKLISNATEHCKPGTPVRINLKKKSEFVEIMVSNEGPTLPEDRESIFELFVSMRDAQNKNDDNFGLGLYIVKLVAESHQGSVQAHNLQGKTGAVFIVTLPLNNRSL